MTQNVAMLLVPVGIGVAGTLVLRSRLRPSSGVEALKAVWRKVIGVAVIIWGIGMTVRGVWQWNEPPIDPGRRYIYVASGQTLDVGYGLAMVLIGIVVYRRGWKVFER